MSGNTQCCCDLGAGGDCDPTIHDFDIDYQNNFDAPTPASGTEGWTFSGTPEFNGRLTGANDSALTATRQFTFDRELKTRIEWKINLHLPNPITLPPYSPFGGSDIARITLPNVITYGGVFSQGRTEACTITAHLSHYNGALYYSAQIGQGYSGLTQSPSPSDGDELKIVMTNPVLRIVSPTLTVTDWDCECLVNDVAIYSNTLVQRFTYCARRYLTETAGLNKFTFDNWSLIIS